MVPKINISRDFFFTLKKTYSIILLQNKKGDIMEILLEAIIDTLKLIPFLFISFIVMELIEHKFNNKSKLRKINKFGPLAGSVLGLIPQCGFSVVASTMYAARVITLGTLFSIYLSTSDEMLPILIANQVDISVIIKILFTKFILGLFFGILIDIIYKSKLNNNINDICMNDECHCKDGVVKSSIIHTLKIAIFIFLVNLLLNLIIDKESLTVFLNNNNILSPILASIVGLIPNCASSVLITELYLEQIIPFGSCIAGLLSGSGLGLLILFKQNKNIKENVIILFILVLFSSICGIILNFIR